MSFKENWMNTIAVKTKCIKASKIKTWAWNQAWSRTQKISNNSHSEIAVLHQLRAFLNVKNLKVIFMKLISFIWTSHPRSNTNRISIIWIKIFKAVWEWINSSSMKRMVLGELTCISILERQFTYKVKDRIWTSLVNNKYSIQIVFLSNNSRWIWFPITRWSIRIIMHLISIIRPK